MHRLRSTSTHLWAPEKAGVRQPLLISPKAEERGDAPLPVVGRWVVTEQFLKQNSPFSLYMVLEQWYVRHNQ